MKIALFAMLFAVSAFAQNPSAGLPAACGPQDASFIVKLNKSQHAGAARIRESSGLLYSGFLSFHHEHWD